MIFPSLEILISVGRSQGVSLKHMFSNDKTDFVLLLNFDENRNFLISLLFSSKS